MEDLELKSKSDSNDSFIIGVVKLFNKLMERFTKGKYNTKKELDFFADENNLYDTNGKLTPEYKSKIKEYEDYLAGNCVTEFIKQVHSEDSMEFGKAYNEQEQAILKSACIFIDDQEVIVKLLSEEKRKAIYGGKTFDFDKWFAGYCETNGISEEHLQEAKKHVIEIIEEILKGDPELREFIGNSINQMDNN